MDGWEFGSDDDGAKGFLFIPFLISWVAIHKNLCTFHSPKNLYPLLSVHTLHKLYSVLTLVVSQPSIHFLLKQRPICYVKFAAT